MALHVYEIRASALFPKQQLLVLGLDWWARFILPVWCCIGAASSGGRALRELSPRRPHRIFAHDLRSLVPGERVDGGTGSGGWLGVLSAPSESWL